MAGIDFSKEEARPPLFKWGMDIGTGLPYGFKEIASDGVKNLNKYLQSKKKK